MWHEVKKLDTKTIHSICKGEMAQLLIEVECAKRNIIVSRPSVAVRYDLILEFKNKLCRTQIKFLNRKHGNNGLELRIEDKRHKNRKCYTNKEIDLLLIYVPKTNSILCLKSKDFHNKKTLHFNLTNPKSPRYYKKFLW